MADWTTNKDLIQKLYIAFYGRPADPGGLRYWAQQLPDNAKLTDDATKELIGRFVNSAEAADRFGNPSIESTVARIYTQAFHRDATDAEKAAFAGKTVTDVLVSVLSVSSGTDFAALNNKLDYANMFVNYLDPNGNGIPDDAPGGKFMATFSGNTDAEDIKAKMQWIDSVTYPTESSVLADVKVIADAGDKILTESPVTGQTFTLTTGADALTGTSGDDTFVASEATLSSADVLDGKEGTDMLRYASSGNAAVNEAGFEAKNIETVQVTSDATGGTTFDVTGVTELETFRNFNSSEDVTLTGMKALVDVELVSIGSAGLGANDPTPDTTLVFNAAVVAGANDAINVKLNGNLNVDGTAIGDLTANGVEIFNVTTEGAATSMGTIISNSLKTVNIAGDQNLTIGNNLVGATTIDAHTFTGNLSVVADSGARDVVVTGGTGNDRADFSNGWDANDIFNGGDGTDTLGLTYAVATTIAAANSGTATSVEVLDVTTAANVNGTIDMDNFASVEKVILNAGINTGVTATIADAVTGLAVELDVDAAVTGTLVVNLKTDGTADELTVTLDNIDARDTVTAIKVADAETLNISAIDTTVAGNGDVTVTDLTATEAKTLNLSGSADITIANTVDPATPVLSVINASAATGNVTISNTNTAAAGATITLGSGNDVFNVATSNGADTITLGAGADTIRYTAVAQSNRNMDTITDFKSGEDKIDLSYDATGTVATDWDTATAGTQGFTSSTQFAGNKASFALAQGALTGGGVVSVVFQQDEHILWVDSNGDGTLDNNDFRVKLDGVGSITAADMGFVAGNSITLTAPAAVVNQTTKTNATNYTTNYDDTITTTIANLAGSTIDGLNGTDQLIISDAGAVAIGAGVQNVENLVLASSSTVNNVVTLAATTDFKSITGGTGVDNVTLTNLVAGGTVSLGGGNDNLTAATKAIIEGTGSRFVGGDGNDTLTFANVAADTTIDMSSVSGFETIDVGSAAAAGVDLVINNLNEDLRTIVGDTGNVTATVTFNVTAAVLDGLTTITANATANGTFTVATTDTGDMTVNLADTTFTTLANVDSITFASGTSATVTMDENVPVTGTAGTDVLNVTADLGAVVLASTNFETINVSANQTGLTIANSAVTVNALAGGIFTLGTGGDTFNSNAGVATTVTDNTGSDTINQLGAGTLAINLTADAAADTITATGTGAVTVNAIVGGGVTTVNLNAANGAVDNIKFANGGAGSGVVAATDRVVISGFDTSQDTITLDVDATTAATAAGSPIVIQTVTTTGAVAFNTAANDLLLVNFDVGGTADVLSSDLTGANLLANLGGALTVAATTDKGYIVAFDNGNAYLYYVAEGGDADTTVAAADIALIGVIEGAAIGSLGAADFVLAA